MSIKYKKTIEKLKSNNYDYRQFYLKRELKLKIDYEEIEGNNFPEVFQLGIYTNELNEKKKLIKKELGSIEVVFLKSYTALEYMQDLYQLADFYSEDTIRAVSQFLDEDGVMQDQFCNKNIAYIRKMYLKTEYRDKGIGSYSFILLYSLLVEIVGLITIIPTPFSNDGNTELSLKDDRYNEKLKIWENFLKKFNFTEGKDGVWFF